jgi:hypothetical protein
MSLLFNSLTFFSFLFLLCDTYFYPGFVYTKIGTGAGIFALSYLTIALILSAKNIKLYSDKFKKINNKLVFPFLSLAYIIILILEKTQYPNFVLATFMFTV